MRFFAQAAVLVAVRLRFVVAFPLDQLPFPFTYRASRALPFHCTCISRFNLAIWRRKGRGDISGLNWVEDPCFLLELDQWPGFGMRCAYSKLSGELELGSRMYR